MSQSSKLSLVDNKGRKIQCILKYPNTPPWYIDFESEEVYQDIVKGDDLFECLLVIRENLEKQGWYILCNGARIDAYPSQMCRQMSGGHKLYILKVGQHAKREDLVDLFGVTTRDKIGSTQEQLNYYTQWLEGPRK